MAKLVLTYRDGNKETHEIPDGHDPHSEDGYITLPAVEPGEEPFKIETTVIRRAKVKR